MHTSRSLLLSLVACTLATFSTARAAELLTIGSEAPALDIEHWVQNGDGKFSPVTKFDKGKVYVVEFWATWCGPCIQSMPHLAQLQQTFADKGVQIVSISDEDLETVEAFLEREVPGASEPGDDAAAQTYRKLTSAYCLTTDPDQSSYRDYMEAAAQGGIPTAFIVGKDSRIDWIGHPMEMDEPLNAIVEDRWDREAFAKEVRERQEMEKAMQDIFAALQQEDYESALTQLDEVLAKKENMQFSLLKLQVLLAAEANEKANEWLKSLFKSAKGNPVNTGLVAWNIYEMSAQGRVSDKAIQATALKAAQASAASTEDVVEKASLLDTVAHFQFLAGDLAEAIATEQEAARIASPRDREFIENFLGELLEAREKAENAKDADQESADK